MKALYFNGTSPVYMEDYKKPTITKGHSLIKVLMSAICNTDREVIRGYRPDFRGVLGHEFVGIVEDSDDETLIGKRVVGELNEGCGDCIYCKTTKDIVKSILELIKGDSVLLISGPSSFTQKIRYELLLRLGYLPL